MMLCIVYMRDCVTHCAVQTTHCMMTTLPAIIGCSENLFIFWNADALQFQEDMCALVQTHTHKSCTGFQHQARSTWQIMIKSVTALLLDKLLRHSFPHTLEPYMVLLLHFCKCSRKFLISFQGMQAFPVGNKSKVARESEAARKADLRALSSSISACLSAARSCLALRRAVSSSFSFITLAFSSTAACKHRPFHSIKHGKILLCPTACCLQHTPAHSLKSGKIWMTSSTCCLPHSCEVL